MKQLFPGVIAALILSGVSYGQTDLVLDRTAGTDPGPGIPACTEQPGWYSLFDGTGPSIQKYWFNPSGQFHGNNSRWWVTGGVLYSDQSSDQRGGCIYTRRQFKNVEYKTNIKPVWGNDAGFFLRANTAGRAYQMTIDFMPGATKAIGGVFGEGRPSGQDINYKPYGFVSPTSITVRSEWYADGLEGRPKLTAADWTTKIWKSNDFNWVRSKIYGDVPTIDGWINDNQLLHYQDPANKAANEQQTGYLTLQVHTGSANWVSNSPNQYKAVLVREVQANGQPLASYPDWAAACPSTDIPRPASYRRGVDLKWRLPGSGQVEIEGQAPGDYSMRLTDAGGKLIGAFSGQAGAFRHSTSIEPGKVHFLTVRAAGYVETHKIVRIGG